MAKLYFKYGAMGSSKTAQALITRYNYEENDMSVWLIKPSADTRDGTDILRSRIGLQANVEIKNIPGLIGLGDVYYFSKLFKRYTGKTPGEYRKMDIASSLRI